MRKIRVVVILFFIVSCICFGVYKWMEWKNADRNAPVITLASSVLEVSASASEKELLAGVSAMDPEDGDLTEHIQIASLSPLIGKEERTIRYIVFDSADRVATAERTLIYTDYESPRIYLKEPLRFAMGRVSAEMSQLEVSASDMIDGDLTNRMRISYGVYDSTSVGEYEVVFQVNNSAGDTCIVPMTMEIVDSTKESGKIYPVLSDYIVYTKVGKELQEEAFLVGIAENGAEYLFEEAETDDVAEADETGEERIKARDIRIRSGVNYDKAGVYVVEYSYTSPEEVTAMTALYVVVEEK